VPLRERLATGWPGRSSSAQACPGSPLSHALLVYDASVVAKAGDAGCRGLVSEDFQHGRCFGSLVVENAFRRTAASP
jgi:predicted nucleic acid-binding protein